MTTNYPVIFENIIAGKICNLFPTGEEKLPSHNNWVRVFGGPKPKMY